MDIGGILNAPVDEMADFESMFRRKALADRMHGPRHYAEVTYGADDYLVFGRDPWIAKPLPLAHPDNDPVTMFHRKPVAELVELRALCFTMPYGSKGLRRD